MLHPSIGSVVQLDGLQDIVYVMTCLVHASSTLWSPRPMRAPECHQLQT